MSDFRVCLKNVYVAHLKSFRRNKETRHFLFIFQRSLLAHLRTSSSDGTLRKRVLGVFFSSKVLLVFNLGSETFQTALE